MKEQKTVQRRSATFLLEKIVPEGFEHFGERRIVQLRSNEMTLNIIGNDAATRVSCWSRKVSHGGIILQINYLKEEKSEEIFHRGEENVAQINFNEIKFEE